MQVSHNTANTILFYIITAVPWLLCPGLCCIGIAGMAIYATNLQV